MHGDGPVTPGDDSPGPEPRGEARFCQSCGQRTHEGWDFCPVCGAELESAPIGTPTGKVVGYGGAIPAASGARVTEPAGGEAATPEKRTSAHDGPVGVRKPIRGLRVSGTAHCWTSPEVFQDHGGRHLGVLVQHGCHGVLERVEERWLGRSSVGRRFGEPEQAGNGVPAHAEAPGDLRLGQALAMQAVDVGPVVH